MEIRILNGVTIPLYTLSRVAKRTNDTILIANGIAGVVNVILYYSWECGFTAEGRYWYWYWYF